MGMCGKSRPIMAVVDLWVCVVKVGLSGLWWAYVAKVGLSGPIKAYQMAFPACLSPFEKLYLGSVPRILGHALSMIVKYVGNI